MKCIDFARKLVSDWTANDGGLTWAASDVTHAGHCADRAVAAGDLDFIASQVENTYGAENEVWVHALSLI